VHANGKLCHVNLAFYDFLMGFAHVLTRAPCHTILVQNTPIRMDSIAKSGQMLFIRIAGARTPQRANVVPGGSE
jgi:hypothetical protein